MGRGPVKTGSTGEEVLAGLDCGAPDVAIEAQHDELTNCSLFAATRRDVGGALEPDGRDRRCN
jgi:hypothetical protein